jgi:branched-chain amino acid transport system substrate-binding protein
LSAGIAGCIGGGDKGGSEDDPISVGLLIPLSGPYSNVGKAYERTIDWVLKDRNNEVDGLPVEVHKYDSETSVDATKTAANKLVNNDNADVIFGPYASSTGQALAETAGREKVPTIMLGASANAITGTNCNKYAFASMPSSSSFGATIPLATQSDIGSSYYIIYPDYSGGIKSFEGIRDEIRNTDGVNLVGNVSAPLGNEDYSSQINQIRNSGADVVYDVFGGADKERFLSQSIEAGLHDEMEIITNLAGLISANSLGADITQHLYATMPFWPYADDSSEFSGAFQGNFGQQPVGPDAQAYDAANIVFDTMAELETPTDSLDLINESEGKEFSYSRDSIKFRGCDHRKVQPWYLMQGKPAGRMESESDYYSYVDSFSATEDILRPCEETDCNM